jgi:aminopeptidase N
VVVNSYFYPGDEAGGEKALQVAIDALSAFTDLFGPYTYTELDVVQTPNYLGGMEYSGLVVLEDSLYPSVVGVEWLTAHEVAHQWWFAMVGNDQVDDPWLDEALTQYSTLLYYEEVYGPERAEAIRYSQFEQVNESLIQRGRNLPIGMAADEYSSGLYWEIVYDKGALYFHNLREAVGDEVFFDIMRTYYRRHKYEIATPESFLDTVEDVSGDRYEELFEEWVVGGAGE